MNMWTLYILTIVFIAIGTFSCRQGHYANDSKHIAPPVSIRVERLLEAPIEYVFNQLADPVNFTQFPGVSKSEILKPGDIHPNGKGAIRMVKFGIIKLEEEIIEYIAPVMIQYIVRSSEPFTIDHKLGLIKFEQRGDKTKVVWISEGEYKTPIIGCLIERMANKKGTDQFNNVLTFIEKSYKALGKKTIETLG